MAYICDESEELLSPDPTSSFDFRSDSGTSLKTNDQEIVQNVEPVSRMVVLNGVTELKSYSDLIKKELKNIENLQIVKNLLYVTFHSSRDAEEFSKGFHTYHGKRIHAALLESWPTWDESLALEVEVLKGTLNAKEIQTLLENENYGGEPNSVKEIVPLRDDTYVFVFDKAHSVKNILKKFNDQKINFSDATFQVKLLEPAKPPISIKGETEDNKLIFSNFSSTYHLNVENFKNFIHDISDAEIDVIKFSRRPDFILVLFKFDPSYSKIKNGLCKRPYCGRMLSVQKVPKTKCIQFKSINSLDEEHVKYYLENKKRSGGGNVSKIDATDDYNNCFIVEFKEFEDAKNVCERVHKLENNKCFVTPYYESMGFYPSVFDCTEPILSMSLRERGNPFTTALKFCALICYVLAVLPEKFEKTLNKIKI